ncbi:MAG: glycosyltransferase family 39 protein [Anaerolineales bacterium]|nr:glycosyltransferase family 39 protein [Anaerolineales bacterium]
MASNELRSRRSIYHHLPDVLAVVFSLAAIFAAWLVTREIYEAVPHLEDEIAYVWQAKVLAAGHFAIPSPDHPKSFLVPFVIDYNGLRFGKYPLGWPLVLAVGERLNLRAWVNPLLAGLGVWLTYRLGKRLFSPLVGLLASGLMLSSPFFFLNSGSLLSHPLGLVLSIAFALFWVRAFGASPDQKCWLPTLGAALSLGALFLTRPYTAVAVGLPFGLHGLWLLLRGNADQRRRLLILGSVVAVFPLLHLLWQYAVTGDPLLNPYTLWWPYDKVGFGPGHGHAEMGHTLRKAYVNTRHSLEVGAVDLFGWLRYSWIFLPFGLWAARRNRDALQVGSIFPSIVVIYMAYWVGSWLFGPRYFYESLHTLTLFSAAGIAWLAGWPLQKDQPLRRRAGWRSLRPLLITLAVGVLVAVNLTVYLPMRLDGMRNLYGISLSDQATFTAPDVQQLAPALVIVQTPRWMEYGSLLDLEDPFLTSDFIFAWSISAEVDSSLGLDFPGRTLYYYDPTRPFYLFTAPIQP